MNAKNRFRRLLKCIVSNILKTWAGKLNLFGETNINGNIKMNNKSRKLGYVVYNRVVMNSCNVLLEHCMNINLFMN